MNKIAIITGASSGIGLSTAKIFKKNNYQIINLARSACTLNEVVNISVDLSEKNSLEKHTNLLQDLVVDNTHIALIHNAFRYTKDQITFMDPENFRESVEIALIAPLILNKIIIPRMAAGSSITYVGSTLSEKAVPGAATYITIKHAIIGLMKATCQDLMDNAKVHSFSICPGFTETPMLHKHIKEEKVLTEIKTKVSSKRLISPEEIASLILYGHQNPVINGSVIHANLGLKET